MAASQIIALRAKAKRAGISNYRALSVEQLQSALKGSGSSVKSAPVKSAPRKSAAKTTARKAAPAKSTGRKTSVKSRPAAKSATAGKAKRATTGAVAKRGRPTNAAKGIVSKAKAKISNAVGRKALPDKLDWSVEVDGFVRGNRAIVFKALKKNRGNVAKTFEALKPDARKMFPSNSRTGERYDKAKSESLLMWNIHRVKFDYAILSGQHEQATNRVAYGTGSTATGNSKPKAKTTKAAPARKSAQKAPARRGRPPGSKNKPKATTAVARRTGTRTATRKRTVKR